MGGKTKKLLGVAVLVAACGLAPHAGLASGPGVVQLDRLANLFGPVTFDHAMHADLAGNCAECHHHTLGGAPVNDNCARCHGANRPAQSVACRDCHPLERFEAAYLAKLEANPKVYHTGRPGLKGAFHQKCLGCHQSLGGPTGCEDCHGMTEKGEAFYKTGKYAPVAPQGGGH